MAPKLLVAVVMVWVIQSVFNLLCKAGRKVFGDR